MTKTRHYGTAMEASTRNAVVARHYARTAPDPDAREDPRMVGLTTHLYAPGAVSEATGAPVICAGTLAALDGRVAEHRSKNYKAEDFLREYRERVDPTFEWSGYDMKRSCRTARKFDRDPALARVARTPRTTDPSTLVYATDGTPIDSASRSRDLVDLRAEAAGRSVGVADHRVERLLDYLNGLPSNRYTAAVNRHHPRALGRADELLAAGDFTPNQYAAALASMAALVAQPTPVYALSGKGRSQRIFPVAQGLLTLSGRLSHIYREDWLTYDLVSAQGAINAVDWGAAHVAAFLDRHLDVPGALWKYLAQVVKQPVEVAKGALKTAFYSVQFGKGLGAVAQEVDRDLGAGSGEAIAEDPLILDFVRARDEQFDRMARDGGLEGAFGDWIPLEPGRDEASVAAERAQGVELLLLHPAVGLATAAERWDIVLWQHDGFDVAVRDRSRWRKMDQDIREAVDDGCRRLGYPTRLVVDRLPSRLATDRAMKPRGDRHD